ncbi:MAG: NAD(P)/FAD-dependent oxidoreductase [Acidimicrobiales bacterium]
MGEGRQDADRVVIVGGGFGGLFAAKALAGAPVRVTLLDRRNHHLFQPLLYQVATAGLNPSDIAYPIRSILRRQANATVLLGEVAAVNPDRRTVLLTDGDELEYDHLIVATGATHAYFGNDHWAEHAPGLKTIEDALEIRRRVLTAFEAAEREHDPRRRQALLSFVVIGGGPTGVELAGAISEIALRTLVRDFRSIDPSTARVVLVEGLDRILSTYPPSLSGKAVAQLRRLGVEVRTSCRVTVVDGGGVDTTAGRIEAGTVVWAAGVAASPLARHLGAPLDRAGRVPVAPDLSVPGHPEILVIGDLAAAIQPDGQPAPGVAPAAMQGGRHAAAVVRADLAGRPRPVFRYRDKGALATIGRASAVADFGPGRRFSGFPAWVLWWLVHLLYLIGFRSRLLVWFGWAWQWLTFQRGARLITGSARPAELDRSQLLDSR